MIGIPTRTLVLSGTRGWWRSCPFPPLSQSLCIITFLTVFALSAEFSSFRPPSYILYILYTCSAFYYNIIQFIFVCCINVQCTAYCCRFLMSCLYLCFFYVLPSTTTTLYRFHQQGRQQTWQGIGMRSDDPQPKRLVGRRLQPQLSVPLHPGHRVQVQRVRPARRAALWAHPARLWKVRHPFGRLVVRR